MYYEQLSGDSGCHSIIAVEYLTIPEIAEQKRLFND